MIHILSIFGDENAMFLTLLCVLSELGGIEAEDMASLIDQFERQDCKLIFLISS